MGLPVARFISAVNENDEFPSFLNTGVYEKLDRSKNCLSSAMNVGHPSNLVRIIDLFGGKMDEKGILTEPPNMTRLQNEIVSYSIDNELTKSTITTFYHDQNGLIEPHGAVGWAALRKFRIDFPDYEKLKTIVFETADPAKFPDAIISLTNIRPPLPEGLEKIKNQSEYQNPCELYSYDDFKQFLTEKYA
jgi:threonine synthase